MTAADAVRADAVRADAVRADAVRERQNPHRAPCELLGWSRGDAYARR
ncbi:hypothetical protein NKH77_23695 [Streptomyces sp. M19]